MATKKRADAAIASEAHVSTDAETLLMAALETGWRHFKDRTLSDDI